MVPARRLTWLILSLALLAACAAAAPFVLTGGPGPQRHTSIRGVEIITHGVGPYRHMPADVAVQGLAQDVVTLAVGVPFLLLTLAWARTGARAGHLALSGAVAYLFVQYFLYLGMATYNELFLLWSGWCCSRRRRCCGCSWQYRPRPSRSNPSRRAGGGTSAAFSS